MRSKFSPILSVVFASVVVGSLVIALRAAERPAVAAQPESLAKALEGVWIHVGEPGKVGPVPQAGGRLKFRMSNRWTFTAADPATGVVKAHFGGTYRVQGNDYVEKIDYSTDPNDSELGSTLRFTVKVEGDTMTQIGVGNPYTEVWKRVH